MRRILIAVTINGCLLATIGAQDCKPFGFQEGVTGFKCHFPPTQGSLMTQLTLPDGESSFVGKAKLRDSDGVYWYDPMFSTGQRSKRYSDDWNKRLNQAAVLGTGVTLGLNSANGNGSIQQNVNSELVDYGGLYVNGSARIEIDAQTGEPTSDYVYARAYALELVGYTIVSSLGRVTLTPGRLSYDGGERENKSWNHLRDPVLFELEETTTGQVLHTELFETNFKIPTPEGLEGNPPSADWLGATVQISDFLGLPGYFDVILGNQDVSLFQMSGLPANGTVAMGDTLRIRFQGDQPLVEVATGVFQCVDIDACDSGTYFPGQDVGNGTNRISLDLSTPFSRTGIKPQSDGSLVLPYEIPNGFTANRVEFAAEVITEAYVFDATQTFSVSEPNLLSTIELMDAPLIVDGGAPFTPFSFSEGTGPGIRASTNLSEDPDPYEGELVLNTASTKTLEPNGIAINSLLGDSNEINVQFSYLLSTMTNSDLDEDPPRNAIEFRLLPVQECGSGGDPNTQCSIDWFQETASPQGIGIRLENTCDDEDCTDSPTVLELIGGTSKVTIPTVEDWSNVLFRVEQKDPTTAKVTVLEGIEGRTIGSVWVDEEIPYVIGADAQRIAFAGTGGPGNSVDEIVGQNSLDLDEGDLNGDGTLSIDDVNAFDIVFQRGGRTPDLNGDGEMDLSDRNFLIEQRLGSLRGDNDLDGDVDFSDFLVLSSNFGGAGGWASGDYDGDGLVGEADFGILADNFGRQATPLAAAVPEPSSNVSLLMAALLFVIRMYRPQNRCHGARPFPRS